MADSFRLAALEAALRAGDCHAFACPHAEEVDFDFGEGGEDVEEHLAHRVGGVVDLSAEGEFDPPAARSSPIAPASGTDRASRSSWAPRGCRLRVLRSAAVFADAFNRVLAIP